ncbi:unnamed protein product [Enterobius vermicularis]|uniref:Helicase n=1 Tax=Enterobius vermicularis TaxID=51028 RepID=A0A0N4VKW2_ENTVE|nr:unnamed protein product [Enterobius vermicularis]
MSYIDLEKAVYRLEKKNVLKKYESKAIFADDIKKTLDQLEATYKELKKQTSNIVFKEMNGARKQYERAARIAEIYKQQCDRLRNLHEQQDKMLTSIFGPDYASEKENRLEAELDDTTEWQQRVSLAKFKWTNGRILLRISCRNTRMRYFAAAEARNNFIAAGQNVQSCRIYLGKVKFPYCTEEEMAEMEKTINTAFNDIQSNETLKKALSVYKHTHKKVAALVQWFDKVINETILKDLEKANNEIIKKQKQLREERLSLMKKRVKEAMGKELTFDYDDDTVDELDQELLALEADKAEDDDQLPGKQLTEILNLSQPNGRDPTPVSQSKLAPIPDKDALFGGNKEIEEKRGITGDVKQKLDEYDSTRKAIEKRNLLEREKQEIELKVSFF